MKIPQHRLDREFYRHQKEYERKALEVLRSGWYVLGGEVKAFEEEFAAFVGTKYCVGLASGLDALWMSFRALGVKEGDEVIVQGNTYIASVMGITMNGAKPVFVEPNSYYNMDVDKIEERITKRTKAILVVHLYGQAAKMDKIVELCKKYQLFLVEDCAQSHGASFQGRMTGSFGEIGCFSFYPSKNIGGFGDGGAIVTNVESIYKEMRIMRNYGSEKRYYNKMVGTNSRLDEIQAGLLRVKLCHEKELTKERQDIARMYLTGICNESILLPEIEKGATSVWHQFVVRCKRRDELQKYLEKNGIGTIIHYPIPPHLAEAYEYLGFGEGDLPVTEEYGKEVLSLPMFSGMHTKEVEEVIEACNRFS